jgi:hypothetical protein
MNDSFPWFFTSIWGLTHVYFVTKWWMMWLIVHRWISAHPTHDWCNAVKPLTVLMFGCDSSRLRQSLFSVLYRRQVTGYGGIIHHFETNVKLILKLFSKNESLSYFLTTIPYAKLLHSPHIRRNSPSRGTSSPNSLTDFFEHSCSRLPMKAPTFSWA